MDKSAQNTSAEPSQDSPQIITGWEHSVYANNGSSYSQERYAYIGKDENGEPEWLDYGRKQK